MRKLHAMASGPRSEDGNSAAESGDVKGRGVP